MRPVTIYKNAQFAPNVCIKCGSDHKARDWFVDLGFDLEFIKHNQNHDGPIMLCNKCMSGMLTEYAAAVPIYVEAAARQQAAKDEEHAAQIAHLNKEIDILKARWGSAKNRVVELEDEKDAKQREIDALSALDAAMMKNGSFPQEVENNDRERADADANDRESESDAVSNDADNAGDEGSDGGNSPEQSSDFKLGPVPAGGIAS